MNEHFIIRSIPSVVSEPDYVGTNGTRSSPIKMVTAILIASIAICAVAQNLLAGYMSPLTHVFWLAFHVLYIGGLAYFVFLKWKRSSEEVEV